MSSKEYRFKVAEDGSVNVVDVDHPVVKVSWLRRHTYEVIAASAAVIALTALVVSLWQAIESRAHNKLAVVPILEITAEFSEITRVQGTYLINRGSGPAEIKSSSVYFDGEFVGPLEESTLEEIAQGIHACDIAQTQTSFSPGARVVEGTENPIWAVTADASLDERRRFRALQARTWFSVCYCSIYQDCWETSKRSQAYVHKPVSECPKPHLPLQRPNLCPGALASAGTKETALAH